MVTHQPKDGHPPEGSVQKTGNSTKYSRSHTVVRKLYNVILRLLESATEFSSLKLFHCTMTKKVVQNVSRGMLTVETEKSARKRIKNYSLKVLLKDQGWLWTALRPETPLYSHAVVFTCKLRRQELASSYLG